MPTIKIVSFVVLIWVVGAIMMNLFLRDLALWWWVPITIAAFAVLNIAASRVMPEVMREKAESKKLFWALLIAMMVTRALDWWWWR